MSESVPSYLSVDDAREMLVASELYTLDDAPSTTLLSRVIVSIESLMEVWLETSFGLRTYTETLRAGVSGEALSTYYPIVSIKQVEQAPNSYCLLPSPTLAFTGGKRTIFLGINAIAKVTYEAGSETISPALTNIISGCIYTALVVVLKSQNPFSIAILLEPLQQVQEIQLPSGLRKRFQLPNLPENQSIFDNIFQPLLPYKKSLFTGSSG